MLKFFDSNKKNTKMIWLTHYKINWIKKSSMIMLLDQRIHFNLMMIELRQYPVFRSIIIFPILIILFSRLLFKLWDGMFLFWLCPHVDLFECGDLILYLYLLRRGCVHVWGWVHIITAYWGFLLCSLLLLLLLFFL